MDYDFMPNDYQTSSNEDFDNEYFNDLYDDHQFPLFTNEPINCSNNSSRPNDTKLSKTKEEEEARIFNQLLSYSSLNSTNSSTNISSNIKKKKLKDVHNKKAKRRIELSSRALHLKNNYFLIFTKKKKFPKTIIRKIHQIMQKYINLKPMTREIVRFNDKYFEEYAKDSDEIIQFLVLNKRLILTLVPELRKHI